MACPTSSEHGTHNVAWKRCDRMRASFGQGDPRSTCCGSRWVHDGPAHRRAVRIQRWGDSRVAGGTRSGHRTIVPSLAARGGFDPDSDRRCGSNRFEGAFAVMRSMPSSSQPSKPVERGYRLNGAPIGTQHGSQEVATGGNRCGVLPRCGLARLLAHRSIDQSRVVTALSL